ncbi:MAG: DUF4091 domain-containing protein [Desulfobacteraceae bacterium]|nr:DUF4091 domain-containing protein [Desulfobacteraceae bacterium]
MIRTPILIVLSFLLPLTAAADLIIWANSGEDKVVQRDLRARADADAVRNSIWNGSTITVFGARNEVVNFNLILESPAQKAENVRIVFHALTGPGGYSITSTPADTAADGGAALFNYVGRNIELFYVRYLQIRGASLFGYGELFYDERKAPRRFQRPDGSSRTWHDRPDHDTYYPDIAVPLELHTPFNVSTDQNQSVWCDIYIPKTAPAGVYHGIVTITEDSGTGERITDIPVILTVRDFNLPDLPNGKTMLFGGYGPGDVARRYTGVTWPDPGQDEYEKTMIVAARHAQMAHRHKISLMRDATTPEGMDQLAIDNLTGDLFSAARGYDGPGVGVGANMLSIGTYGSWQYAWLNGLTNDNQRRQAMWNHSDAWVQWFNSQNFTTPTEYFLYLIDESIDYDQQEQWAGWLDSNPGLGNQLMSFATSAATQTMTRVPSLDISCSLGSLVNVLGLWETASAHYITDLGKRLYFYNGDHVNSGSFCTDEDGVALRVKAWTQYKLDIDRWFYWESTYYDDYQSDSGETDLYSSARTFGKDDRMEEADPGRGRTGWNYSNGDGVLFYPGTDYLNGERSVNDYGIDGPFASLRLKFWRRGIQDVDYLTLAEAIDADAVQTIVNRIIPETLWEYGCGDDCDPDDPTWARYGPSWSDDPDTWESARADLSDIIASNPIPIDIEAPSAPIALSNTALTSSSISLQWQSANDNVGVAGYHIYRNNGRVGSISATEYTDVGLLSSTTYAYQVRAFDAAGNLSGPSDRLTITTAANGADNDAQSDSSGSGGGFGCFISNLCRYRE